ncbi:hypothetical protein AAFF_G00119590 [Aldrovandia affinis]|uniref:S-acyl fatty acid synthase thioesterase, medium chain n=1 Tax=Aldrovandia affinis TaxID=143900 RepID=A0AAD7RUV3_9TELE|nr:hypothetical protein AAFF_G00119590 [Aldrovandia affinis]
MYHQRSRGCYSKVNVMELSRVIQLLEDPFSSTLEERHLFVLKKMFKRYQNGFHLKDIADVFKILNLCVEKAEDHSEYILVMCDILKICGLPLLKEKSSDEMHYAKVVKESLSQMGYLMRVPSAEVRLRICASITSFFNLQKSKQPLEGFYTISPGYRVLMVEESGVAEIMVLSMALLENQPGVKLQVLKTLQTLTSSSEVNCSKILKAQGASKICCHMNEPDPSGQLLFRSTEILWNMLEKGCKEEVTSQLSNMDCIMSLKDALLNQILNGFQQYDQQLRNDLLVLITLIAENANAPLIESGLAKQLILFATFPEIKSHNPLVRNLKLSFNYEDFEMKRLLLNVIVVMSKDISSLQLFKEGQVLLALLLHLRPSERTAVKSWNPIQQGELQLHALSTLLSVAPLLPDDYMTCQGNTLLLLLMDLCTKQDACSGQGRSCHGSGGKGEKKVQMRSCVRVLRAMASLGNETINQDLCDQGAISSSLETIMQLELCNEEEDAITLETMTDLQQILSVLCENDLHRKELFGSGGVDMLVHFLKGSSAKFYSGLGHNKLLLSTVDCVWSCINGCDTTEDMFLEKEGVFLLLDLLHMGPRNMQAVVLGTLLELCDNPKTPSHIHTWRGQRGLTAAGLLVLLWRQEEKELGLKHNQDGTIADTKINIFHQEEDHMEPLPADRPTAAVMDVSDNLQAKIYSIFSKLGFEDLPGLTTEDHVTLSTVSRYLDLKVMEVWKEIGREVRAEGVRPVTPDEEVLETIAQMGEDTVRALAEQQAHMLESQKHQDICEERLSYTEICSNRKQQELTAKSWEHHVAKTSNYKVLMEARELQEKSIKSSRSRVKHEDSVFHSTQIVGLQTTHFCGRVVAVESTPSHLVGGPLANTELALETVPIRGGALQACPARAQDLEHFHRSSEETAEKLKRQKISRMEKVINCFKKRPDAAARLLCFPWAGGGSIHYARWGNLMDSSIEVYAVKLSGRESRVKEPFPKSMQQIVDEVVSVLLPELKEKPFALFGHSFGAMTSYATAEYLKRVHNLEPVHLFLSGASAPYSEIRKNAPKRSELSDEEFLHWLTAIGGTPPEILANPEVLKLFLPVLKADLHVVENYKCSKPESPFLTCPVMCFDGKQDVPHDLQAWKDATSGEFTVQMLPGSHFYLKDSCNEKVILDFITKHLETAESDYL